MSTLHLDPDSPAYYRRVGADVFQPTLHAQGAWNADEQHMAPISGLLAHCVTSHDPQDHLQLARVTFEILGFMPALPTTVQVETVRRGRTIELVEATATAGGRPVLRALAWRLAHHDTAEVAGGLPDPMPDRGECVAWVPSTMWAGGYIRSIELVRSPASVSGRGQCWLRTRLTLVEDEAVSPVAAFVGLVDTANGMNTRLDPTEWLFPNIDLSIHLHREPVGGPGRWVGFDTQVTVGAEGVGLTSTTLHDEAGAVGRAEQILTVRPMP